MTEQGAPPPSPPPRLGLVFLVVGALVIGPVVLYSFAAGTLCGDYDVCIDAGTRAGGACDRAFRGYAPWRKRFCRWRWE